MAKSKAVWGIDIGQCALKAVKLSYDAKEDKAVLEAFDFVEHPKILSQPDAEPDELIRSALQQFLSRNDVDEQTVYLSVPGQAGLARVVKLPPVESKKVADIVKFEANQQIPFKLDDVAWDYQLLGSGEVTEGYVVDAEVGIFAIKKENVGRHLTPLDRNGIEVDTVQLAPVALYNFAAFDQFLHSQQKIESPNGAAGGEEAAAADEEGDTVVILDIGADNTDLVVTNGDSIWMRNLPIGGNHFTRALTKELKLTFAKAEHMKRNATKAPDPKKLYQAMRPVFQDFANELQRSIGFFSSTNRQRQIRKIIGVGNGFKLPGLQKFLQQHLQYPVEKVQGFHGLRGDSLAEPVFMENVSSFCVAYGLALQGLKQTPVQTNLLPQEIRTARMIRDKKPWTLTAAAAVLLGFGAMFLGSYNALSAVKNPSLEGPKKAADSEVANFKKLQSDYEAAKGEYKKTYEEDVTSVGFKQAEKRLQWIEALKWLNDAVPSRGNIEDLPLPKVKEVNIEAVQGAFVSNTGDWYGNAFQGESGTQAKTTLSPDDQKAGPSGEGWVFQMLGYSFNEESKKFVTESILARLQDKRMRDKGFSHACIYWYERNPKWSPKLGSAAAKRASIMELLKVAHSGSMSSKGGRNVDYGTGRGGGLGAGTSESSLSGSSPGGLSSSQSGGFGGDPRRGGGGMGALSDIGGMSSGGDPRMSGGRGRGGMAALDSSGGRSGREGMEGGFGDERLEEMLPEGFMDDSSGSPGATKAPEKTIERTDFEIHVVFTPKKPGEKKDEAKK
jgi:type IV pilus assembly protein PilM